MGSYYADYTLGNNANPGSELSPKKTTAGLTAISHGTNDSSQPSFLYLKRGETWPSQTMTTSDGESADDILTIDEYGAGATRPTLDYQEGLLASFATVVRIGSHTSLRNIRVENVGPATGNATSIGGRGISPGSNEQNVEFFNIEIDGVAEGGLVLSKISGPINVEGCYVRDTGRRWIEHNNLTYPPPIQMIECPDINGGTGSATTSDNVVEFGAGEGLSFLVSKNQTNTGGIVFACQSTAQSINCCNGATIRNSISYGTTDSRYWRDNDRCGYGLSTRIEPGYDADASLHDNIRFELNLVAYVNFGIDISTSAPSAPASYSLNVIHNTFVNNFYNFRFGNNNDVDGGSLLQNNSSHVYNGNGAHSDGAFEPNIPASLDIDYNNWEGSLETLPSGLEGPNDTVAFGVTKVNGWTSIDAITDLGAYTLVDGVLECDEIAEKWRPTSLQTTIELLEDPYNDWFGDAGLANPGAILGGAVSYLKRKLVARRIIT